MSSWRELREPADKSIELRRNRVPHKFATFRGHYTMANSVLHGNLARVICSPNNISHSLICAEAEKLGAYHTQGFCHYCASDMANADYVLCWRVDPGLLVHIGVSIHHCLGRIARARH